MRNPAFKGVFAALTTPFNEEDAFLPKKLEENIEKYNQSGLAGYVVLGSTAESVFLSDEESEKIVKIAKKSALPGKKIIAGTARESTKMTIAFTNSMAALGVDAALVRTPGYFKSRMTPEVLKRYFVQVADGSKMPVFLYNIPQNTGISLDSSLIIELAQHPNIAGIKDSSGNLLCLAETIPHLPPGFSFVLGAGGVFLPGLFLGACGAILAVADAAPEMCLEIYKLFLEGKTKLALKVQQDLIPLQNTIVPKYGIPGLKFAMDLAGFYGGPPRPPLLPVDENGKKEIIAICNKLGLAKE